MYTANPPITGGWIEDALGLAQSIWGSPESAQAEIEQAKLAQIRAQLLLEQERKRANPLGMLGAPGPLGLPYGAWLGLAVIGGVFFYQRGGR